MKVQLLVLVSAMIATEATAQGVQGAQGQVQGLSDITGNAGGQVTLNVTFPFKQLLNRKAPNTLTLSTPWGQTQAKPSGPVHSNPEFSEYYARVNPLTFKITIPKTTRTGTYVAKLTGALFTCDQKQKICVKRDLNLPLNLQVNAPQTPATKKIITLRLTDELLNPNRRWRP